MRTVLKYIKPYALMVALCLLIKGISAFVELAIPSMLAVVIDEHVPNGDMQGVLKSGALMLLFAALTCIFNIIGNRLAARATGRIIRDLRHDLFDKTLHLDTASTDKLGLSSLTSRLTSDTYNVMNFIARLQRIGIRAPMMLIGGIVITLTLDMRIALVLIAVLPFVSFTVYKITKRSLPIYTEEQRAVDTLVRRVDETASGIRVIKALSKTDYERERFAKSTKNVKELEIKAGRLVSATKPVNDFIFYMGFCAVVAVGALIAKSDGEAAVGKLLTFMTYFTIILNSMIMMSRIFVQASRAIASAERIEEVLLTETTLTLSEGERDASADFIEFRDVTFSYNKKKPNVENITFNLARGQTLGIIGATGSGKSTLASLLLRLYDVDSGSILIDGRDVRTIPKAELHSLFGVAFQYDFVSAATLRENISFFRDATDDEINAAASVAQATGFIEGLAGGLDYVITQRGANLSGGQRQRLLISRALAKSPEILILDDSSSALDYKTDKALRSAIKNNVNTTTIIISQRIASVSSADKILVIDEGRIIGEGTHTELMRDCSEYRDIARVQLG